MEEDKYSYQEIWEHQSTILYIANYRFKVLKYLKQEYDNNNQAAWHRFIFEAMYAFREAVIMDLCKLFITPIKNESDIKRKYKGTNSQLNFYYNIHQYKAEIEPEKFNTIQNLLVSNQEKVDYILTKRDKEIGHKDLSYSAKHRHHLDDLSILEELIEIGKQILLSSHDHLDLNELYEDSHSIPVWAGSVLEAINLHRNEQPAVKYINGLQDKK